MKVKVKYLRSDFPERWDFLKGTETFEISPMISLYDLGKMIHSCFGIPDGRSFAFYMDNDTRKRENNYSDNPDIGYKNASEVTLAEAMRSNKFKYEYSFSDGIMFQCTVE